MNKFFAYCTVHKIIHRTGYTQSDCFFEKAEIEVSPKLNTPT